MSSSTTSTPRGIAASLKTHTVEEAKARGWDRLANGALLHAAETAGFEVLLTVDQGFIHQQNLKGQQIAVVILGSGQWPLLKPALDLIVAAVEAAKPGTITFVEIPRP